MMDIRLARYCARCPVALERLDYPPGGATVSYQSDKATGPTAGPTRWTRWSSWPGW